MPDIFDRLVEKRKNRKPDIFDKTNEKFPRFIIEYINEKNDGLITKDDAKKMVDFAISNIKPLKQTQKVVERQIIKEEKKDDTKYAKEESISDLKKQIKELNDQLEKFKEIIPLLASRGGSGVVGLPDQTGKSGKVLSTNGSAPIWVTAASGGGSPESYTVSNVTTQRTLNANDTSLDELADVLGSLITDMKAAGMLQ